MLFKLMGMLHSPFGAPIEMEILDIVRNSDRKALGVRSKKTILEVIERENKSYTRDYSVLCMTISTGNTVTIRLHALSEIKLITITEDRCKSIWT